jgi:Protein of unknown function (DUF2786)
MPGQDTATLEKVRKLLAMAEDPSVTPAEAEAFTAKASEKMARYGIDRALLAATQPETDQLTSKKIDVPNPWGDVHALLLGGLAKAMRCDAIQLTGDVHGKRLHLHLFGYASDLERTEVLYTSLLLQMANGLARQIVPGSGGQARAWRRSWLIGFASEVTGRVAAAERSAAAESGASQAGQANGGAGTAVVLADRALAVKQAMRQKYPTIRATRMVYSGGGAGAGREAGRRANIGGTGVGGGSRRALS